MPDAITYAPSDQGSSRTRTRSGDADLAAVLRRVLAERERKRRQEQGGGSGELDVGADLLALPAATMASAGDAGSGEVVDLSLGGVPALRASAVPLGGVRSGQAAAGLGVDLTPGALESPGSGGGGVGLGGVPGATVSSPSLGPAGITGFGKSIAPGVSLGLSPLGSLGLKAGPAGLGFSPVTGLGFGLKTGNAAVDTALSFLGPLAGLKLGGPLAGGIPGLAGLAAPFGLAGLGLTGMNLAIQVANAIANKAANLGFDVTPTLSTLQSMGLSNPDIALVPSGQIANALAALANNQAVIVGPEVAVALGQMGAEGFAVPGQRGSFAFPGIGPTGLPSFGPTTNFGSGADPSGTAPGGGVPGESQGDVGGAASGGLGGSGAVGDSAGDVGGAAGDAPGGGDSGGGGSAGGDGSPGPGPGPGDPGDAPFLATWAMRGLGIGPAEQRRRGWAAFKKSFDKRFPLTGESQFRRYARLARQVVEALEQRPVPEQRMAQRMIYARIVAPLGETLELHEVDEAWTAMRATALMLAKRLGLQVDPADVPQPAHEVAARARQRQQERVKASRERAAAEDTPAAGDAKDRSA